MLPTRKIEQDQEQQHTLLNRSDHEQHGQDPDDIELSSLDGEDEYLGSDDLTLLSSSESLQYQKSPAPKKSYLVIVTVLIITVIGFTVNTESTAYFEDVLGWKKPFCTMYITHSSLCLPTILHLIYSRLREHNKPTRQWFHDYKSQISDCMATLPAYTAFSLPNLPWLRSDQRSIRPLTFLATTMVLVTLVLTVSGCSWFVSLSLTTPADLTAIYNCSTFFAAVFSVPLLKQKLSWAAIAAVALSITGTFIIAYGDTTSNSGAQNSKETIGTSRLLGNLVACIGAVAFGLYEVLFKKWADPGPAAEGPDGESMDSLPLAFAASALTGVYTMATLWVGLVVLHVTGVEVFVLPGWRIAGWIAISVLSGSLSISLLVLLVVWTDPVFGSMASVLSVFFVAIADWLVFGLSPSLATYVGGALIMIAFGLLTRHTLGEMK